MFYLNDIDEVFSSINVYEVTKENHRYSLFDNTPEALAFVESLGLRQGSQPEGYDKSCPYIWTRANDYVYSKVNRGGAHKVKCINGIYCRVSNDSSIPSEYVLTICKKDTK